MIPSERGAERRYVNFDATGFLFRVASRKLAIVHYSDCSTQIVCDKLSFLYGIHRDFLCALTLVGPEVGLDRPRRNR